MRRIALLTGLSALLTIVTVAASSFAQTPPKDDPLFIRLAAQPAPQQAAVLDGGGRQHSAYEVYLTNAGVTPMKIVEVGLTGDGANGKILWSEKSTGARLVAIYQPMAHRQTSPATTTLRPGESGALFLFPSWTTTEQGAPANFETTIAVEGAGQYGGSGAVPIAPIALNAAPPIVIESPLRGANWLAENGPSNTSDHRRAVLYFNGRPYIGQRYAIDWIQLGADGKSWTGDYHSNASYHAYDQEIHAVADGKIVEVKDGLPENIPNSGKFAVTMSDETIAGNHIIEDLGGGHFAAYAHLRPGTIKVKAGDSVHAGDVLGHLGNTGNSTEPHLHFQVCDAPSFLKSEGLPFAINAFVHQEYQQLKAGSGSKSKLELGATHPISREEPMENELDSFDVK